MDLQSIQQSLAILGTGAMLAAIVPRSADAAEVGASADSIDAPTANDDKKKKKKKKGEDKCGEGTCG